MKATLEKLGSIKECITVEVPTAEIEKAKKKVFEEMRKEIKVKGFRKGKVPDEIIEQRYGDELRVETMKEIVKTTYPEAVKQVDAHPLRDPQIEPAGEFDFKKPFTFKATFEVYPEVTIADFEKLPLECEKISVTDEEVEAELKRMQQQMTQLEPAPEGAIGPGMVGMIDFKGTAGGEPFPGSEAENYVVDFGGGSLLKEFEVQIEGMKTGEEREIEFDYPKEYFKPEIAGKKGAFAVTMKEVRRKAVPEINDEFAKEVGKYENLKEVRKELKKRIADYKEMTRKNQLKEQAIRQLIEKHKELEVPTALVDAELGNMLEQQRRQVEASGQKFDESKIDAKEFVKVNMEEATSRARGYMIVSAIAKQEKIEVSDEEISKKIEELAAMHRQPVPKIRQHFEKEGMMTQLKSQMIFEKTLDLVLERAKIKEKKPKKVKK